MGYVDENLMEGERVVYRTQLHWIIFALPALILLIAICVFALGSVGGGIFFLFVAAIVSLPVGLRYSTSEFAVTDRRVMIKVGWISRHTLETLLTKVENISVNQDIGGRVLDYGTLVVTGTGGTKESFKNIADPIGFRRRVQEQISKAQELPATPAILPATPPRAERECPYCAELILAKARVCKHCGRDVEPVA